MSLNHDRDMLAEARCLSYLALHIMENPTLVHVYKVHYAHILPRILERQFPTFLDALNGETQWVVVSYMAFRDQMPATRQALEDKVLQMPKSLDLERHDRPRTTPAEIPYLTNPWCALVFAASCEQDVEAEIREELRMVSYPTPRQIYNSRRVCWAARMFKEVCGTYYNGKILALMKALGVFARDRQFGRLFIAGSP